MLSQEIKDASVSSNVIAHYSALFSFRLSGVADASVYEIGAVIFHVA